MKHLFTVILLSRSLLSFAQSGNLLGNIQSATKEPLIGISVGLQGTALGTPTDEMGNFTIKNIPAGNYTLTATGVGYIAKKLNVIITDGKTTNLNLQLSENQTELQEVVVIGEQNNYLQSNTSLATRTDAPILEVPQSAQVIGQQVIKDVQAFTLNELSKVMTGVKANNDMGAFSLRGFNGYFPFDASFITFNGIRGNLYLWSQAPLLYNIEKVEVLRGPASVLFSEGIPGGTINFATKKPLTQSRYEFNAAYGTWNQARFSIDATGPLTQNKKLLYRLIAGYDRANSFRNQQKKENYFIAPSFTYQFNNTTSLNLEINYAASKNVHQYDRGTFVKTNADGTYDFNYYPKELTIQSPTDFGKPQNTSAVLSFSKQFSQNLSVNVVQRYIRNKFKFADHVVSGQIRNDSVNRSYEIWDYDQYSFQTTAYANYKLKTGTVSHSILAGIDYNSFGWYKNDYRNSPSTRISIFNPNYTNDIPVAKSTDYYDDNVQNTQLTGAYLQDQISIWKLRLLLSIRHDNFKLEQTPLSTKDNLQGDRSDADAWVPRVGLVFLAKPNLAFYGSYNKSFSPQLSNRSSNGGPFPPRTAQQFEVGYKGDFFNNQLSTTVAVYDIKYNNILVAAPTTANPNQQAVVDGTRSKGFEVTIQGNIKDLSIIAGYAYNDHIVTQDNSISKKSDRFLNAPRNIGNIWVNYQFSKTALKGIGIGIGGRYMSDQVGNISTQKYLVPESTVLDASLSYSIKQFGFQANVYNFTDQRYFNGGLSRIPYSSLGNPINVRLGISYLIK